MYRHLTDELVLFSVTAYLILSKEIQSLYCPNSRVPEFDHNGIIKQCLPGQGGICGPGFTCFFSGINYQCCPAEEDGKLNRIVRCPSFSLTVLTNAGLLLPCNPGFQDCPQDHMQCVNVGGHSICCEKPPFTEQSKNVSPLIEPKLNKDIKSIDSSNEVFDIANLECPEPAFTILDGNGDPFHCDEENCSHQANRFCYKTLSTTICCENEEKAIDDQLINKLRPENKHRNGEGYVLSGLDYSPFGTTRQQLLRSSQNNLRLGLSAPNLHASISRASIVDGSASEPKKQNLKLLSPSVDDLARLKYIEEYPIGDGVRDPEAFLQVPDIKITMVKEPYKNILFHKTPRAIVTTTTTNTKAPSKTAVSTTFKAPPTTTTTSKVPVIITMTTATSDFKSFKHEKEKSQHKSSSVLFGGSQEISTETIRYTPHNAGGYAVSRTLSKKTDHSSTPNARDLVREYLFEQIQRGWPYGEEFYREYVPSDSRSHPAHAQVFFHDRI